MHAHTHTLTPTWTNNRGTSKTDPEIKAGRETSPRTAVTVELGVLPTRCPVKAEQTSQQLEKHRQDPCLTGTHGLSHPRDTRPASHPHSGHRTGSGDQRCKPRRPQDVAHCPRLWGPPVRRDSPRLGLPHHLTLARTLGPALEHLPTLPSQTPPCATTSLPPSSLPKHTPLGAFVSLMNSVIQPRIL